MIGYICFGISISMLVSGCLWAATLGKTDGKRSRFVKPFHILASGVAISAMALFLPIYAEAFKGEQFQGWETFLLSLHNTIRLFIVDGEFSIITDYTTNLETAFAAIYSLLAAVLFVIAPFLTFGVVLSFFKNASSYKEYFLHYFSDVYVFSDMNEQALALAKSLKEKDKKRIIVFNDVFSKPEETYFERAEMAHMIGAITFKRDISALNFGIHSKKKKICFFVLGNEEDEKIRQTKNLIDRYKEREHTSLFLFSTSVNSELMLNTIDTGKMKVRRVNEVQSLVQRILYDEGYQLFETAVPNDEGEKEISAVILGMGLHGTEMTKALSWFCQMDGYHLSLNAFEADKHAKSRFCALCPELMDSKLNGKRIKGEPHYEIEIHSKTDVETKEFLDKLELLPKVTYVFVALGDDEKNIKTAISIRTWLAKRGIFPRIDAIVYNTEKKEALEGIVNYSQQSYEINFVGDLQTSYSEEVIFESDIEAVALERHLKWGDEESFWKYEYNYRSSVASAIHRKMKVLCEIPGVDKPASERTHDELWNLRILEHCRWNAYMRSEGYTHAEKRNNLAKTHHCLVPFDELSPKEQAKDDD